MEEQKEAQEQTVSDDFAVGTIVFHKYEILGFIAAGGNGRVYKARDTMRNTVVALKVLLCQSKNERELVRFQSEAKLASKMRHRNIATIYDFGLSNGTAFLSMEFVEGESLEQILQGGKTFSLTEFCEIFIQVCEALVHAQKHSIVHRDLKPGNIASSNLADGKAVVKVLDFGLAKIVDNVIEEGKLTPTGNLVGSPYYMSPEQAQGLPVTTKSDNYSLGCVMWHCLAGQPPFQGDTAMETVFQHVHGDRPKLNEILHDSVPHNLTSLIEALLSKSPLDRPSTAIFRHRASSLRHFGRNPEAGEADEKAMRLLAAADKRNRLKSAEKMRSSPHP